ncbi:Ferredoxin subunit of nitrite reductase or a ring-hydroxylating dioxygenase [Lentzea albidocapillata subsp. violacea]|uniref:Cytochrome bc1 complex Rieske iron-sulfur subunit n=1 Tax=Lentzea albidocapillata subsp. violacea TaxID=128104 RepID=A0A1G9WEY1_9PSEU|nr:Rieske (2Fe-2S) protein [Lentzea albidocapillata]SDM82736.1 Ferredoxin subunit of nitrite reductase or a ring-hydroxylating dioxygenase [Lentzea albidocapillata subsp. violacea]
MNTESLVSRRAALCGIAVALAVPSGLVTACSSTPTSTGSGTTPTQGGSTPTGSAGTSGTALVALADVPEGGGAVVDAPGGKKIVVARISATEVKAYDATCPHQGSMVAEPSGGTITCPSHGSQFGASDGAVKKGPATTGLRAVSVKVDGDQVVLT